MKIHLYESPDPLVEGLTWQALCGALVANVKAVALADTDAVPIYDLPTNCWRCRNTRPYGGRYLYSIVNGQELRDAGASDEM